jgi:hypothetical protein
MDKDYDLGDMLRAIRRYWWIALLTPTLVLTALVVRNVTAPYQCSFRASILLPGDTEIPGSAERPELMILDDLGPVVASQAFAQMVADRAAMPLNALNAELSASRYSRIATITVKSDDQETARRIAEAAAQVLPDAVNRLMVADGEPAATVQIIDPPETTMRGDADQWRTTWLATVTGLAIGCFLAVVLDASLRPRESAQIQNRRT